MNVRTTGSLVVEDRAARFAFQEAELLLTVNRVPLHTDIHYQSFTGSIWQNSGTELLAQIRHGQNTSFVYRK